MTDENTTTTAPAEGMPWDKWLYKGTKDDYESKLFKKGVPHPGKGWFPSPADLPDTKAKAEPKEDSKKDPPAAKKPPVKKPAAKKPAPKKAGGKPAGKPKEG